MNVLGPSIRPLPCPDPLPPPTPRQLRRRSLAHLGHMGHCAPTVMATLLDAFGERADWPILLVSGLPGGIGNTGNECGGVTAPLVLLGLRHARDPDAGGVPAAVRRGRALVRGFLGRHGTTSCREILGHARLPLRCARVVELAPERCLACSGPAPAAGEAEDREWEAACAALHAHLRTEGFHCAHEVLRGAREPVEPPLADALSAFVGGSACSGLTCSALAAGVMLLGLDYGRIEHSAARVLRMLGLMAVRADALADGVNAFNRAMNEGSGLARWFAARFGSTQCTALTGCDLTTRAGVRRYVEGGGVSRCREVAGAVAAAVRLRQALAAAPTAG